MVFKKLSRGAAAVAAAIVLGTLSGVSVSGGLGEARAADASPASTFGNVDMQRCVQESKLRQQSEDEFHAFGQSLDNALKKLASGSNRLLSEQDLRALAALYEKSQLTPTEQKQQADLEAKADTAGGELSRLQQNASPSDAEKKRFTELTQAQQKGDATLQAIRDDYNARLQQHRDDVFQKMLGEIRTVVAKVAKEKGLSVVFDSQTAVYTPNDITADVIKALNK